MLRASPSPRSCPTRRRKAPSPSSRRRVAYYPSLGVTVPRVMTDNGSCYRSRLPRRLPRARPQAHPHQALHAQDQRQGRALHPDRAARMGLRPGLPDLRSPRRRTAHLAAPIQLASSTRRHRIPDAHQPPRSGRGQPIEAPHLVMPGLLPRTDIHPQKSAAKPIQSGFAAIETSDRTDGSTKCAGHRLFPQPVRRDWGAVAPSQGRGSKHLVLPGT